MEDSIPIPCRWPSAVHGSKIICRMFRLSRWKSTSLAGKMAVDDPNGAALGSRLLAETLGLRLLREDIEDEPHNVTRFLVVGNGETQPTGSDKTTLMFFWTIVRGRWPACFQPWPKERLTCAALNRDPCACGLGNTCFFVDLEGHRNDPALADAMAEMKTLCVFMKWLGSYPSGDAS